MHRLWRQLADVASTKDQGWRLNFRQQRVKVDLVHDDPEKELLKEIETIQGVQALLQRTIEQAVEQNR